MPYWFDGNNLIGQSAADSGLRPERRQAFLETLSRYRQSGGGRYLVYFDGDAPHRSMPPPGVRVRYSAPLAADDAIIRRLHEISRPGEIIVVTNDLELQSRCRASGAKVMGWSRFEQKMRSRKDWGKGSKETEQSVDVEDWMEYFGLEE